MSSYNTRCWKNWIGFAAGILLRRPLALCASTRAINSHVSKASPFSAGAAPRSNKRRAEEERGVNSSRSISFRKTCASFYSSIPTSSLSPGSNAGRGHTTSDQRSRHVNCCIFTTCIFCTCTCSCSCIFSCSCSCYCSCNCGRSCIFPYLPSFLSLVFTWCFVSYCGRISSTASTAYLTTSVVGRVLADIEYRRAQRVLYDARDFDTFNKFLDETGQEREPAKLIEARNMALATEGIYADCTPTMAWNCVFGDKD